MEKQPNLCESCRWAKDKVNNQHCNGCYCIEYGYIVAHGKNQCRGYESEQVREPENHG